MSMTKEARAARAKYMREWRKKNPDKAKAIKDRYWERQAEKIRQQRANADGQGAAE